MTASNLERSIELVFGHEGGYVNHPDDPGGPTKFGITQRTLSAWRGKPVAASAVKDLTLSEASQILRKQYWQPVKGDDLPAGLDHALFDYAVNSGPAQAVKTLQRCVGEAADGIMGARTLAAIAKIASETLINQLCDARLTFLKSLKTWRIFGKGWQHRVERVRKEAKIMLRGSVPLTLSAPSSGLEQAHPADTSLAKTLDGKAATTAGIGVIGTACSDAANQLAPYTDALPVLRWLFIGLTITGISIGLYATFNRIRSGNA